MKEHPYDQLQRQELFELSLAARLTAELLKQASLRFKLARASAQLRLDTYSPTQPKAWRLEIALCGRQIGLR